LVARIPGWLKPYWVRLEGSPLGYRLAQGAFWGVAGGIVFRVCTLAAFVVVARLKGTEAFGELGVIQSTVAMFGIVAGFSMGQTSTKHVAELRHKDPERAGRIIALSRVVAWTTGVLASVALFVAAPWLASKTIAAPHLSGLLRVSSPLLLLGAIAGTQTGALLGFEAFKRIAQVSFISGLLLFPLIVAGTVLAGLQGAVCGLVVSQACGCWLNYLALQKEAKEAGVPLRSSGWTKEWEVLWRFSVPAVTATLLVSPVTWVCNAILVNGTDGYKEMGLFNAANQWRLAILVLPGMVGGAGFPMLSRLHGGNDHRSFRWVFWLNLGMSACVACAVALPVALCARFIMASYGESFVAGAGILMILCVVAVITAALSVVGQVIASEGRMWFGFLLNAIWAMVLVGSSLFLIPRQGALGMALANLIAYGVHLFTVSVYLFIRLRTRDDG
jgi:O-antigen/teichoic acid export membrane protein